MLNMKLISKLIISLFILISLFGCGAKQEIIEENKQKQMRLDKLKVNSLMDKKFEQCMNTAA